MTRLDRFIDWGLGRHPIKGLAVVLLACGIIAAILTTGSARPAVGHPSTPRRGPRLRGATMTEPTPPENVRAVMADGREIPLDCEYGGLNEHGPARLASDDDADRLAERVKQALAAAVKGW